MSKKPFYVSTPIYYVNDKPHLGHAYTTVACDAKARFHRLRGEPTQFLTGTDEHGQKLERAAREAGMSPLAFCDMNSAKFRELWEKLDISYDDYIRTTEERHIRGVQELWRRVEAAGDIYLGAYAGWYAVRDEAFYTESELTEAPGGVKLGPTGAEVEWVEEPSYFFRLSNYAEPLLAHYEKNPLFVQPESRRNEVMSFVRGGLKDLSLSRTSFQWGIPVPGDEKHVIYVWFDALSNYLTAPGFDENGVREGSPWPTDQHFIGKDILRFHAVYWPAFLLSAGVPLPGQVFSHGWWTVEGQKMSKSLGNAVDPHWLIEEYGVDAIRYFLLKEIPFGLDGDFSHNALIDRINSDLANDLGNLLHRTLSMVKRYREGLLERSPAGDSEAESAFCEFVAEAAVKYERGMSATRFQHGLRAAWEVISCANKYIDSNAPWALAKEGDEDRLGSVLWHAVAAIRVVAAMISPVMPASAQKIAAQLGLAEDWASAPYSELMDMRGLPEELITRLGLPLFPRIEAEAKEAIQEKVARRIAGGAEAAPEEDAKERISFKEFQKMDLRTAQVLEAERIPKSKNLLKLTVSLGEETRTVVAGLAKHYAPEDLRGRQVILVANLEPAKLMGVESQGMVLAAEDGEKLLLAGVDEAVAPGAPIR